MESKNILLKDLLSSTKDGEWGKGEADDGLKEMLVIRGTDFAAVRYGDMSKVPVRFIPQHLAERKKLQPGDILIETAGGTQDQPTGRTVFLKPRWFEGLDRSVTCSSFSRFLRVDESLVVPEYMFWHLQYLYETEQMHIFHFQHTGLSRFQFTNFSSTVKVRLPPLDIQRRIADILGTLDDKIEVNRRINRTLEAMAQALFKHWFVDFGPFQDGAFIESELGLVPAGWRVGSLGEIARNERVSIDPQEVARDTPYIGLADMPQGSIALDTWGMAGDSISGKRLMKKGQILFGKLRPYFKKVGVAPVDGVCSTDILVIVPKLPVCYSLVLCQLTQQDFIDYTTAVSDGTRMPRVSWQMMAKYPIVLPKVEVIERFNKIVEPWIHIIINNVFENRALAITRDYLLPRLLSGEISAEAAEEAVADTG